MKLIVKDKEIDELNPSINWSGDDSSCVRKLGFEIAYQNSDYYLKKLNIRIDEGDLVLLKDDAGKPLFTGVIIDIAKSEAKSTISYIAFDFMFFVKNSDINKVFDTTAETIAKTVCDELGIKTGEIASTGLQQYQVFLPENAYAAIQKAYQFVTEKTGKKYVIQMDVDKLSVKERGQPSGVTIDAGYNLIDAEYKISLSKLVNKVMLTDQTGSIIETFKDANSMKRFGTVQKVVKDDKDKAKSLLHGAERTITVNGLDDLRAVTGKSLKFINPDTNKEYIFHIISDSHSITSESRTMTLGLSLE